MAEEISIPTRQHAATRRPKPTGSWLLGAAGCSVCFALISGIFALAALDAFPDEPDRWYVYGLKETFAFICERAVSHEQSCQAPWLAFEDGCYRLFPGPTKYESARDECIKSNSKLTSIHSPRENEFVHTLCEDAGQPTCIIGLRRKMEDTENWAWEDDTPFNFTGWARAREAGDGWEAAAIGASRRISSTTELAGHIANVGMVTTVFLCLHFAISRGNSRMFQCSMVLNGVMVASCCCIGILALLVISTDPEKYVPEFLIGSCQVMCMACVFAMRCRVQDEDLPGLVVRGASLKSGDHHPSPVMISGCE